MRQVKTLVRSASRWELLEYNLLGNRTKKCSGISFVTYIVYCLIICAVLFLAQRAEPDPWQRGPGESGSRRSPRLRPLSAVCSRARCFVRLPTYVLWL